jgi:hypothetical protein
MVLLRGSILNRICGLARCSQINGVERPIDVYPGNSPKYEPRNWVEILRHFGEIASKCVNRQVTTAATRATPRSQPRKASTLSKVGPYSPPYRIAFVFLSACPELLPRKATKYAQHCCLVCPALPTIVLGRSKVDRYLSPGGYSSWHIGLAQRFHSRLFFLALWRDKWIPFWCLN